jgi:hypothetical protein
MKPKPNPTLTISPDKPIRAVQAIGVCHLVIKSDPWGSHLHVLDDVLFGGSLNRCQISRSIRVLALENAVAVVVKRMTRFVCSMHILHVGDKREHTLLTLAKVMTPIIVTNLHGKTPIIRCIAASMSFQGLHDCTMPFSCTHNISFCIFPWHWLD